MVNALSQLWRKLIALTTSLLITFGLIGFSATSAQAAISDVSV